MTILGCLLLGVGVAGIFGLFDPPSPPAGESVTPGEAGLGRRRFWAAIVWMVAAIGVLLFHTLMAAVVSGALCALCGFIWLGRAQRRRETLVRAQIPAAISMLGGALASGNSIETALRLTGEALQPPLGPHFLQTVKEMELGVSLEDALLALGKRVDAVEFSPLAGVLLMQAETGADVAQFCDSLRDFATRRQNIRLELRSVTAPARLSTWMLVAIPWLFLWVVSLATGALAPDQPGYTHELFASHTGHAFIVVALLLQAAGVFVVHRMLRIEV